MTDWARLGEAFGITAVVAMIMFAGLCIWARNDQRPR